MIIKQVFERYPGNPGEFIQVIPEKCTGCGLCKKFCTMGVWIQEGNIFKPLNLNNCVECGACWNICKSDAIIYQEPRGGTGVKFSLG